MSDANIVRHQEEDDDEEEEYEEEDGVMDEEEEEEDSLVMTGHLQDHEDDIDDQEEEEEEEDLEEEETDERIPSRKSCISSDPDKTDVDDLTDVEMTENDRDYSSSESPLPPHDTSSSPNKTVKLPRHLQQFVRRISVKSEEGNKEEFIEESSAPSIRSRRPSRSCKPNSLIFNEDTTTLTPIKRRRKTDDSGTSSNKTIITDRPVVSTRRTGQRNVHSVYRTLTPNDNQHRINEKKDITIRKKITTSDLTSRRTVLSNKRTKLKASLKSTTTTLTSASSAATSSKRSFARESVRKAVSALTNHVRLSPNGKKIGRPRKYPLAPVSSSLNQLTIKTSSPKKTTFKSPGKKLSTPNSSRRMNPILAAIISGQELGTTKTGKPKGRPRILPALDDVLTLNGHNTPVSNRDNNSIHGTRSSSRRGASSVSSHGCDCDSKYRSIMSNFEQSLETKFVESTQKLRKDMQDRDDDNIRLHSKIIALQKEVEVLRMKLLKTEEDVVQRREIEELKAKHQREVSLVKRTQWVCIFF